MAGEAAASSPTIGLRDKLSRPRRSRDRSAVSARDGSPRRGSTDSAGMSKLRSPRQNIDGSITTNNKLAKLIPGHSRRQERRQRQAEDCSPEGRDEPRGRSPHPMTPSDFGSNESVDDGPASFVTSDSEEELNKPLPPNAPPLLNRQSHVGYLTSSSPTINVRGVSPRTTANGNGASKSTDQVALTKASTLPDPRNGHSAESAEATPSSPVDPLHRAATLAVDPRQERAGSLEGEIPAEVTKRHSLQATPSKRSTSSVGARDASTSPSSSFSNFFKKDQGGGSLTSRRASKMSDTIPAPIAIETSKQSTPSHRNLPTLVTVPSTPPAATPATPSTTVTPPTPVDRHNSQSSPTRSVTAISPTDTTHSPHTLPDINTRGRSRSDATKYPPSKLSQALSAPLTPLSEEVKTPGSRGASGASTGSAGGFFSSVFSVAQNAANSISNTLATNAVRPRASTSQSAPPEAGGNPLDTPAPPATDEPTAKPLAIDTIGTGDLSLSHLGISADSHSDATASAPLLSTSIEPDGTTRSRSGTVVRRDAEAARQENLSAARAVSAAYENHDDGTSTPVADNRAPIAASGSSVRAASVATDRNGTAVVSADDEPNALNRSTSIRSRTTERGYRKKATSSASNAAVAPSNASITTIPTSATTPKVTGFAVANKKRNKDFHGLFRSVPDEDYLIEDYSCALQRDIILAGRIYISESHVCFLSNILGWVTTLVISFDEIVSIEKENTAMVFPNAIAIQTIHARHTFRSLLSRDATYDLMIGIWKINHPGLQSSENGVRLTNGATGSKTEKVDGAGSDVASLESHEQADVYNEDDESGDESDEHSGDDAHSSAVDTNNANATDADGGDSIRNGPTRKASALGVAAGQAASLAPSINEGRTGSKNGSAAPAAGDFPGPAEHAPTECADASTHYEKILKDEVVAAPLGKVFSMTFGAASGSFMSRWLQDEVKVLELQMDDNKKGLTEDERTRTFTYIKPLNSSIGPKQTKCIITEHLDAFDLDKAISVTVTTQTPDVPSGNVFSTKTRYCFMWGPGNGTRIIMSCMIEWTGKSWIKGAIEKGANDGQTQYAQDLIKAIRAGLSPKSRTATMSSKKKGRKRKGHHENGESTHSAEKTEQKRAHWGLFEPVRESLAAVMDICRPLISANSVIGFLVFLLIISWFGNSRWRYSGGSAGNLGFGGSRLAPADRIAAYEELWAAEEAALWHWLEERVGMADDSILPGLTRDDNADQSDRARQERARVLRGDPKVRTPDTESNFKTPNARARDPLASINDDVIQSMGEREVAWAIDRTEKKLRMLKDRISKGARPATSESTAGTASASSDADATAAPSASSSSILSGRRQGNVEI